MPCGLPLTRAGSRRRGRRTTGQATHLSFEKADIPSARVGSVPYPAYHSAADLPDVVDPAQLDRVGTIRLDLAADAVTAVAATATSDRGYRAGLRQPRARDSHSAPPDIDRGRPISDTRPHRWQIDHEQHMPHLLSALGAWRFRSEMTTAPGRLENAWLVHRPR
jgi:hypothetical protein